MNLPEISMEKPKKNINSRGRMTPSSKDKYDRAMRIYNNELSKAKEKQLIVEREATRRVIIEAIKQGDFETVGLATHKFGDLYAHTYIDEFNRRVTYTIGAGHAHTELEGHAPDYVNRRQKLFKEFTADYVATIAKAYGASDNEIATKSAQWTRFADEALNKTNSEISKYAKGLDTNSEEYHEKYEELLQQNMAAVVIRESGDPIDKVVNSEMYLTDPPSENIIDLEKQNPGMMRKYWKTTDPKQAEEVVVQAKRRFEKNMERQRIIVENQSKLTP